MRITKETTEIDRAQISVHPDFKNLTFHLDEARPILAPVVVRKTHSDSYEVVSGHGRFLAAEKSKVKVISCLLFQGDQNEAEKLRTLDWIHGIGEYGILRHPDAYKFYRKKKAEMLTKKLPEVLLNNEAWLDFLRDAVSEAFVDVFDAIFEDADDKFKEEFREFFVNQPEFDKIVTEFAVDFSEEAFKYKDKKTSNLEGRSWNAIEWLCDYLFELSDENQDWAEDSGFNLPLPKKLCFPFSEEEAKRIFNHDKKRHLALFQKRTKAMLKHNTNSGLITAGGTIKKSLGKSTKISDGLNFHVSKSFIPNIKIELEKHTGKGIDITLKSENFEGIFLDEFLAHLNCPLARLYEKIRADENNGAEINEEYIGDCFDTLEIATAIYSRFKLDKDENKIVETIKDYAKVLFVRRILENCTQSIRISKIISKKTNIAKNDIDFKKKLQSIFVKKIRMKCESLEVHYQYLDSPNFEIHNPTELLGYLLLMHRSYRHYIKQEAQSKRIFLKRKIRFCTIEHHLGEDRVLSLADGSSEFMFTFDFGQFGKVFPILKTFSTGNFDYHVQLFGSYAKSLTKKEREESEDDAQKKSTFVETLSEMMKKAKPAFTEDQIPKVMVEWIGSIMRLKKLSYMDRFLSEDQRKILKTLVVFTFTLMFIEGRRNTGAFALHGLAIKELLQNQGKNLNDSIISGRFIMTPTESKASGQLLQRFFRPKCVEDLDSSYLNNDVAERSFSIISDLKPNFQDTEGTLQNMFGLNC